MSFELIEAEKAHYPKALMCRALGLSRSGHHACSTRGPSRRALEEQQLDVLVAAIFAELGGRYGAPRIEQELRRRGHCTSRKRVASSLRRQGLAARPKRRWKRTTDSNHAEPIAPNRIEGTGSYGAGLGRFLRGAGVAVVEVSCPSRKLRRRRGKSDPVDAEAAALAALAGEALGVPKTQDGPVEIIRMLRLQRRSAIKARSQAANQIHAVISTAPEELRAGLRDLPLHTLVVRLGRFKASAPMNVQAATEYVLRGLAERWEHLENEVTGLDKQLGTLVRKTAPELVALRGIGTDVAGTLLVAAGDNPERLHREASFAALCGVLPSRRVVRPATPP
jgi:hypothetical protein